MDKISGLCDELLISILSLLPTKVAVSTSLLSKRWKFLWMWLTKLEYGNKRYSTTEFTNLSCFLDRNMPLHRALVIESFHLELSNSHVFKPEDIKLWVMVAVSCYVRELEIFVSIYPVKQNILPTNLYTCKLLVVLKLKGTILLHVPRMVCLPSLKTLELQSVCYFNQESLQRLISNCHLLEDLYVVLGKNNNAVKLIITVSSLHRLSLYITYNCYLERFVIDIPSLKYLKLVDPDYDSHQCLIENMSKLAEAYVDVNSADINAYVKSDDLNNLIGSIASVEHFTVCSKAAYGDGFIFNHLKDLTLYV